MYDNSKKIVHEYIEYIMYNKNIENGFAKLTSFVFFSSASRCQGSCDSSGASDSDDSTSKDSGDGARRGSTLGLGGTEVTFFEDHEKVMEK